MAGADNGGVVEEAGGGGGPHAEAESLIDPPLGAVPSAMDEEPGSGDSDGLDGVTLSCRFCTFVGKRKSEVALHEKLHGQRAVDDIVPFEPEASPARLLHQAYPVALVRPGGEGGGACGGDLSSDPWGPGTASLKRALPWEYYDGAGGSDWSGDAYSSPSGSE